jgi:hypothetical protein
MVKLLSSLFIDFHKTYLKMFFPGHSYYSVHVMMTGTHSLVGGYKKLREMSDFSKLHSVITGSQYQSYMS